MTLILTPLEAAGSGPKENEKSERGAHCARPAHVGFHVSFSNGDPHPHHAWAWARAPVSVSYLRLKAWAFDREIWRSQK